MLRVSPVTVVCKAFFLVCDGDKLKYFTPDMYSWKIPVKSFSQKLQEPFVKLIFLQSDMSRIEH